MTLNELRKALAPAYEFWLDTEDRRMYIVARDTSYIDKHGMLNLVQSRGAVASFIETGSICTYYVSGHKYHFSPSITNSFNINDHKHTGLSNVEKDAIKSFLNTPVNQRDLKHGYAHDFGNGSVALMA